ncbi:MAG TPA: 16S rRNA (guanine(527)-N(7))-methyltransferase RsmG [Arenicellales bacterium]|nr:16S rRNA (guanine(527)-N(7))-methyltransferase RsmG [Arenicellales bacterium]
MDTVELIARGAAEMGLALPRGAAERLDAFLALLRKWNRAQNLTAITEPRAMVSGHVLDSLAGQPWLAPGRVLDVGSGAGLPGIPLAIAEPGREFVLLDSRRKRVQFLLYACSELGLGNVSVVESRIEKYRPDGNFGTLTARAFAAIPEIIRLAAPFIETGARLVVWRGSDPSAELAEALAGGDLDHSVHPVRVPGIRAPRHIAVIAGRQGPRSRAGAGAI